jgi:hypothetical protein
MGAAKLSFIVAHQTAPRIWNSPEKSGFERRAIMIPNRFVVEYPERCLELMHSIEAAAHEKNLLASFSLLVAASAFVIPYERMKVNHAIFARSVDGDLHRALHRLDKEFFLQAGFWQGSELEPNSWRFSRIMKGTNDSYCWQDNNGQHPLSCGAANYISRCKAEKVLRTIRNALAHGNIVYLDREGYERAGAEVEFLAFLARCEESEEDRRRSKTHYVVVTTPQTFIEFVKAWAKWVASFPRDYRISDAA